ncbi:MAG: gamma-glutamyl-gamma-aminobutyrate hydrolase family protein [Tannerella sp.]|jgi:microsomal dipeptidase-like Zn-dependent dipeptidase/gamma-glutamyl-gamma-aminobutyrate hydrolase PuuD|nr:gamma-glutamyl-gamma-aminobutyrate hydrolase family protein [Tannerella sp.]
MMKTMFGLIGACLFLSSGYAQTEMPGYPDLNAFREITDSAEIDLRACRPPLIGISVTRTGSGGAQLGATYIQAVLKAGGTPVAIPAVTDTRALRRIVMQLDGLILSGGEDVDPLWYGETPHRYLGKVDSLRDAYEFRLLKLASDRNMPVLGICRGEQVMNVYFGGTLYQDIPSQRKENAGTKHRQELPPDEVSHTVSVVPGSRLAAIVGEGTKAVNSLHHQSVREVAPGFRVTAYAPDSVVEAIEAWPVRPALGVQWHPEQLTMAGDTVMEKILRFLVAKADTFRLAKEIHDRILSLDTHTDTPLWFDRPGFDFARRGPNRVNLPKMEEGKLDGVCLAAFIRQGARDSASLAGAVREVTGRIESIHGQIRRNGDLCELAVTPDDFTRIKKSGKKAIFIGIENGYAIGRDTAQLAKFRQMGVIYMTLCHLYDNDICDTSSPRSRREWNGLSPFGGEVVRQMNRLGMIIDLSHASDSTFRDVLKQTSAPVICSHSSARALCDHDRNLTDDQLRALAQNGGVIQVCLLNLYIHNDPQKASLTEAVEHIDHIVRVAGIDHAGIGSDFDGGGGLPGLEGANDLIQITVKLLEKGYSEEDIAKIWGGNFLRVMRAVQEK